MEKCLERLSAVPRSPREEIALAIERASRDPIARRRRELLERNEDLLIPDRPKRFAPATVSRLLWCAFKRTEEGR